MRIIDDQFNDAIRSVAIAGHVNPDGDCVGSTTALWQYIRKKYPDIPRVDLYLEPPKKDICFMKGVSGAFSEVPENAAYDLFITCDVSCLDRIGVAGELFGAAKKTVCIDHHVSNTGFAEVNYVEPDASSCAEVLFYLMEDDEIDRDIAESLYTGLIHDCGVFQYRNTSPRTMRCAAALMEKGIDFSSIIEESFNSRSYLENRVLGYLLQKAELFHGGRCIGVCVTLDELNRLGATTHETDIVVSQLRLTEGVETAVFVYETEPGVFKASFRSNTYMDVSEICNAFGGGGHVRAAGCTMEHCTAEEALHTLVAAVGEKLL
ncbi:MAG: bifunctional oligoribonuclease/PAP phosphatase NrnA [Lachnospiraceae bacterium]|nr:bifunctional oligoribonuclease/PAP phosphatase NrnA [Lachnospiraceae bacterium]